jgi:hypothetical protein
MYLGLHVKCTIFLPDSNQIWGPPPPRHIFVIKFPRIKFHKIRLVGVALICADGRAGMTKVIGTLCDGEFAPRRERMKGVVVRDATYMVGGGGRVI